MKVVRRTHRGALLAGAATSALIFAALSFPTAASAADADGAKADSPSKQVGIETVVVTAQKREERLQDVPAPITVLSGADLTDNNQLRLQDYQTLAPGLTVVQDAYGTPQVYMRGLTTGGFTNPAVGIVIDDVPFGSSTSVAFGEQVPDFDPSDLKQVEVLRGPQGTLYGASSLGGLIKYVTVDPSTDAFSGRMEVGSSGVYNGAELGYSLRGALNIPVTDSLAVRVSGFTRQDPGFVDNVETGQRGINRGVVTGGRFSALWQPSESVSLKINAIVQQTNIDGSPQVWVQPGLGDLQQTDARGTGTVDSRLQAYNATLKVAFNGFDVTSVSGFSVNQLSIPVDDSPNLGASAQGIFGVNGASIPTNSRTNKFSQELRLSSPTGQRFEWLVGGFYTHENSQTDEDLSAINPITGVAAGSLGTFVYPTKYTEYAGFVDLTYHLTDQFDIQIGAREGQYIQSETSISGGLFGAGAAGATVVSPGREAKSTAFTYLVTPEFKFSPDLMAYARFSSGYRPGGPNLVFVPGVPAQYAPDKTENYEIGLKGALFDHTVTFDASLYYIDWKNIQLFFFQGGNGYESNGSRAKSEGAEVSAQWMPTDGLTIASWVALNDASLTEDFPAAAVAGGNFGVAGNRLPYSSRFSGNLSVDDNFPVTDDVGGFVGGSVSYVGDRKGLFTSSAQRQDLAGYARVDLHVGANYEGWKATLFLNNLTDERGALSGGLGSLIPSAFVYIQPRTVGGSIAKSF